MCDYTQREYQCGHFRWIVSRWCPDYTKTHKRCPPHVTHFEYRGDERCSDCRPQQQAPVWYQPLVQQQQQQQGASR